MTKKEALKHIKKEYCDKYFLQMDKKIDAFIKENEEKLLLEFIENFRSLCLKIKEMQAGGLTPKIAYITYSFGIDNINGESQEYEVQAYGKEWFFEESEECKIPYDVRWLYSIMEETYKELLDVSKKYIGQITSDDLADVRKRGVVRCDVSLVKFVKIAIEKAVQIDEFKLIEKEEVLEIRIGEYKGYNEIIYKEDIRKKDSKEIVAWLEGKNGTYSYEILSELDLSGGDYEKITMHYADLSKCDLSNANFKDASLIGTKFIAAKIDNTNFKNTVLAEANFDSTVINNSNFQGSSLRASDFSNAKIDGCNLQNVNFSKSNLSNCIIKNTNLEKGKFLFTCLENSDLSEQDLRNSLFSSVNLKGANLSDADLRGVEFENVDLTQTNLDNAKFGQNKIFKLKILAKDVAKLDITEEQKKELIIVN